MEVLQTEEELRALGDALSPELVRIITSPSGHFVILRFLQRFPLAQCPFILACLQKSCLEIATDHHGLRVLKTILDMGPASELHGVFKAISRLTMKLAENQYGNYCIQHVLENAPANVCTNIKMKMEGKYCRLAKQKFSSNVVEKCLRTSTHEWRSVILRELTTNVNELIRDRYGNYVLQTAVSLADGPQVMQFSQSVGPYLNSLRDNVRAKWLKIIQTASQRVRHTHARRCPFFFFFTFVVLFCFVLVLSLSSSLFHSCFYMF